MADKRSDETMTALEALRTVGALYVSSNGSDAARLERLDKFVRAISARDAQIRRDALVEGARWALEQCERNHVAACDPVDPAAILERKKGTE